MSVRLAEGVQVRRRARGATRRAVQVTGRMLRTLWRARQRHRGPAPVPTLGEAREQPLVVKL